MVLFDHEIYKQQRNKVGNASSGQPSGRKKAVCRNLDELAVT